MASHNTTDPSQSVRRTFRVACLACVTTLAAASPALAQIVGGSGGLISQGEIAAPGIGAGAQGTIDGSVGVDDGELRDRTGATARGATDASKRTADRARERAKSEARNATPDISFGASGAASASEDGADVNASASASVQNEDPR